MPRWSLSILFSIRPIAAVLCSEHKTASTSALHSRSLLNSKFTNRKRETGGAEQTLQSTLVHSPSPETIRQSTALFKLSGEHAWVPSLCACLPRAAQCHECCFMLQIDVSKSANSSIQSPRKMRGDRPSYTSSVRHFCFSLLLLVLLGEGPWDIRNAVEDQGVPGTHAVPASAHDWNIQAAAAAAAPAFTSETVSGPRGSF